MICFNALSISSIKSSMSSRPIEFGSKELMIKYAKAFVKKKFNFDLDLLLRTSKLLDNIKKQKRLDDY